MLGLYCFAVDALFLIHFVMLCLCQVQLERIEEGIQFAYPDYHTGQGLMVRGFDRAVRMSSGFRILQKAKVSCSPAATLPSDLEKAAVFH